ncbi:MAG: hypothetical protein ACLTSX_03855 [Collinsella sp.]
MTKPPRRSSRLSAEARAAKDWGTADAIRDQPAATSALAIEDTAAGSRIKRLAPVSIGDRR